MRTIILITVLLIGCQGSPESQPKVQRPRPTPYATPMNLGTATYNRITREIQRAQQERELHRLLRRMKCEDN